MPEKSREKSLLLSAVTVLALAGSPPVLAVNVSSADGHADVLPFVSGNTIDTGYYDFDLQQVVENTRLFVRDLEIVQATFFGTTNPGFTTFTNYTLPASSDLTFNVPVIAGSDATARNVLYWDGLGQPNFGAPRVGEDFFLRRSSALNVSLDGGTSPVNGFAIDTANPSGQIHNHISFQARGTGGARPGDGFYLFAMQLNADGLAQAEPVYFLFNADYLRDGGGQILFNGNRPATDTATEALAIDWVLANLLTTLDPADLDADGDVDDADFGIAFAAFTGPGGVSTSPADLDGDGDVDDADFGIAFASFTGPGGSASVPEPNGAFALIAGIGMFVIRRRRGGVRVEHA